ncbi:uncharacterized protein LOC134279624 isoform X2 [Saccostrea cucullata]|uniref:uncharacterized protein LOC134279624 isoform X2 n=1 Tax=Saccostrea cuccullata TaxID=36930 RepID=UPI002ED68A55
MDLVNHLLLAIFALISFKKMLSASTICAMDRTCCLNYNWNPVFKTCKEMVPLELIVIFHASVRHMVCNVIPFVNAVDKIATMHLDVFTRILHILYLQSYRGWKLIIKFCL